MSGIACGPGAFAPSFGDSARSIEYRTASAVTGWFDGGENRYPGRILNTYVLPSPETSGIPAAISGCNCDPPTSPWSG
jgi:hypothetical protein